MILHLLWLEWRSYDNVTGYVYIHSYICFDFETQVAVAMNLFCIVFFSRFHFKNLLFWRSMDTLRIDQKKKERKEKKLRCSGLPNWYRKFPLFLLFVKTDSTEIEEEVVLHLRARGAFFCHTALSIWDGPACSLHVDYKWKQCRKLPCNCQWKVLHPRKHPTSSQVVLVLNRIRLNGLRASKNTSVYSTCYQLVIANNKRKTRFYGQNNTLQRLCL